MYNIVERKFVFWYQYNSYVTIYHWLIITSYIEIFYRQLFNLFGHSDSDEDNGATNRLISFDNQGPILLVSSLQWNAGVYTKQGKQNFSIGIEILGKKLVKNAYNSFSCLCYELIHRVSWK